MLPPNSGIIVILYQKDLVEVFLQILIWMNICRQWRLIYRGLCDRFQFSSRWEQGGHELEVAEEGITHISEVSFLKLSDKLETIINQWLKSPEFINIELKLRSHFNPESEIHLIIETNNEKLRR